MYFDGRIVVFPLGTRRVGTLLNFSNRSWPRFYPVDRGHLAELRTTLGSWSASVDDYGENEDGKEEPQDETVGQPLELTDAE